MGVILLLPAPLRAGGVAIGIHFCDPERKLALASGMIMDRKDFVASTPEAAVTFTMTGVDDQCV